ncbi:MAG TPA: LLM class F420-dependent oxidoreductase [Pseudonocardia sp.]
MDFGVATFVTDYGIDPVSLGRAVEERGFESLYVTEHTHIPACRESPWPGGPGGGELPKKYFHTFDPFVVLSAVAATTSTIRLGTAICLVIERDPITLAKEVASLDRLSGGRFTLGVGAGWNHEEMANHGTEPSTRMALLAERLKAMREIWTNDEASFNGKFVNFDRIWSWPKPIQSPPPILVGGMGPKVIARVLDYGDGWMPLRVPMSKLDELGERITDLRTQAADAGRPRPSVTLFGGATKPEAIARYAELGIDTVLFDLPDVSADEVPPLLDEYAELAASIQ